MKKFLLGCLAIMMVTIIACDPEPTIDPCETDKTGFLTVTNGTSGIDAIGMDYYIGNDYIQTISPGGSSDQLELDEGTYEIEGRASDGSRVWPRTVEITICDELSVTLGG